MRNGSFRPLLDRTGPRFGLFSMEFATPGLPLIVQAAGADFLVLDMEHSGFTFETVKTLALVARGAGLPMAVRIAHQHPNEVSRALDVGAVAIMAPLVSTPEQARSLVAWATYPPAGERGIGLNLPHDGYAPGPVKSKTDTANANRTLIVQIETGAGVQHADEIAATPGVDCLWIGHMDLSQSLGVPGQFEHPTFLEAVDTVRTAARQHGKSLGRLAGSVDESKRLVAAGFDLIALYTDVVALQQRLAEGISALKESR